MAASSKATSNEKLVAMGLGLLAVISPLIIDRKPLTEPEDEDDELLLVSLTSWLPILLVLLLIAITVSCFLGKSLSYSDPYCIHRIGGSSCGILFILGILLFILRCKSLLS
ncbi:hypothetical protein ACHQM5_027959 [Ranunculus cassubicifolius]